MAFSQSIFIFNFYTVFCILLAEILKLNGNLLTSRVNDNICALRGDDGVLEEFIVDCPARNGNDEVVGVICGVPTCCSECRL
jgi:hypothetical protein